MFELRIKMHSRFKECFLMILCPLLLYTIKCVPNENDNCIRPSYKNSSHILEIIVEENEDESGGFLYYDRAGCSEDSEFSNFRTTSELGIDESTIRDSEHVLLMNKEDVSISETGEDSLIKPNSKVVPEDAAPLEANDELTKNGLEIVDKSDTFEMELRKADNIKNYLSNINAQRTLIGLYMLNKREELKTKLFCDKEDLKKAFDAKMVEHSEKKAEMNALIINCSKMKEKIICELREEFMKTIQQHRDELIKYTKDEITDLEFFAKSLGIHSTLMCGLRYYLGHEHTGNDEPSPVNDEPSPVKNWQPPVVPSLKTLTKNIHDRFIEYQDMNSKAIVNIPLNYENNAKNIKILYNRKLKALENRYEENRKNSYLAGKQSYAQLERQTNRFLSQHYP